MHHLRSDLTRTHGHLPALILALLLAILLLCVLVEPVLSIWMQAAIAWPESSCC